MENGDEQPAETTFEVRSGRVLFVEGTFDAGFLRAVLDANTRSAVQVDRLDGEGGLRAKLLARSLVEGFEAVDWVGVALDADRNPEGQWQSARNALAAVLTRRFVLPTEAWSRSVPSAGEGSASVIVFPGRGRQGRIETFLAECLADQPGADCIGRFLGCLGRAGAPPQAADKAWVYAYLATLARPGQTLSAAARAGDLPTSLPGYARFLDLIPRDDEAL